MPESTLQHVERHLTDIIVYASRAQEAACDRHVQNQ
jgi:hypothetical protein